MLLQNTAGALPPKEIVIQNNNKHVDFFVLHGSKPIFGAQFLHVSIKNTVEGVCPGIFGAKLIPVFQYCCNADLFSVTHVIFFTIRRSQRFTTRLRLEPSPVYLPWNEHLVTIIGANALQKILILFIYSQFQIHAQTMIKVGFFVQTKLT